MSHPKQPPGRPAGSRPQSSRATLTAAAAVLAAHGRTEYTDFRLRRTEVSPDDVLIAPVVGGNDTMPGTQAAEWEDKAHKTAWFDDEPDQPDVSFEAGVLGRHRSHTGGRLHDACLPP